MHAKRRILLLPSLLLFLITLTFLLLVLLRSNWGGIFGGFGKNLFSPRRVSASWSVLEEIRNLEELETASYQMRAVFPYDFTNGENVNWSTLKAQYDYAPETFLLKAAPEWHPDGRLPPEWKYAELYAMCRQAGIDPGRANPRFIVLSTDVQGGVDLELWQTRLSDNPDSIRISISQTDGRKTLILPEPPISVTSFSVADKDSSKEGFPDVPLSPEEWGRLVNNLENRLINMALEKELLERAGENAKDFLREIFLAAGYDDVQFINS